MNLNLNQTFPLSLHAMRVGVPLNGASVYDSLFASVFASVFASTILYRLGPLPLKHGQLQIQTQVGEFVYKGGLRLSSEQTMQLHGFSDLDVLAGKHHSMSR